MSTRTQWMSAYELACEAELQAFKPGNVSVYSAGHDMTVEDFRVSSAVSAKPITDPDFSLGKKIYTAIEQTRNAVGCNTNLGIVLLCAPLIQAMQTRKIGQTLRQSLADVLAGTSREDADWTFRAISLAAPGGLGKSEQQDVAGEATMTLTEVMGIAANKDKIAYQFTSDYKEIFDFTVFLYNANFAKFGDRNWATLAVYTGLLSEYPDSHIERKYGNRYTRWVSEEMQRIKTALDKTDNPKSLMPLLFEVDSALKKKNINPGTTADITVATVLVILLEKLINGDPIDLADGSAAI